MPRRLLAVLLLLLVLSAGCKGGGEATSAAPPVSPSATVTSAAPTAEPTARPTAAPTQSRTPAAARVTTTPRPAATSRRTAPPVPRRTLVPPPGPPPPGFPPYQAPTVAATRFIGCPQGDGGGWTFTAEVDLVGGSEWMPVQGNLQHTSGSTYRWTMPHTGNGPSAPPAPAEQVTWGDVDLRGSDGAFHKVVFPAAKVIRASCPT